MSRLLFDEKTFVEFQRAVARVSQRQEDGNAASEDHKYMGSFEDPRPLLQNTLAETGVHVTLTPKQIEGRFFAVVDGNHRLVSIKDPRVLASPNKVDRVRCGVVKMESILLLIQTGTLINRIRGIQAEDNFYDRVIWVSYMVRVALSIYCVCELGQHPPSQLYGGCR